ncbi:MAG: hypothetical protein J0L99_08180 [Chitinophagales bacterium]|nr:hypothetical protein [Chitinophagales bacterium]
MNLTNTQFEFGGKLKRNLIIGIVVGAVSLGLSALNDDEFHTRFWTNWLHNSVFFTGIAFMAMFFMCAQIIAFGGWNTVVKRVWEAMSLFMWVGLVLMGVVVVGVWGHMHHLYHWNTPGIADPTNPLFDRIIAGKVGFLNPVFFTVALLGFLGIWAFWAYKLRQLSIAQDTNETASFDYYKKIRKWAATFLPLGGFLSTVFLWQSIMSIDPHWYSTMFAWYSTASIWLGAISITIMLIVYLKSKGYMEYVSREHLHDLGKFLFGISVFWTYLWFDQFMLIWYANNGEETIYFNERMTHYPVLFWGNLLLNFITPFFVLMRNDTKRKLGTLFFASLIVFFGHWWDYFYMIKPGARIAAFEAKEIKEGKIPSHSSATKHEPYTFTAVEEKPVVADTTHHTEAHATEAHGTESHAATAHAEAAPLKAAAAAEPHDGHQPTAGGEAHGGDHAADAAHGDGHGEHGDAEHHGDKGFKLGFTIPGFEELGAMIGFLSLFLFMFFTNLSKASMVPMKDPFLDESLHHDTGVFPSGEGKGEDDDHGHH